MECERIGKCTTQEWASALRENFGTTTELPIKNLREIVCKSGTDESRAKDCSVFRRSQQTEQVTRKK